MKKRILSFLLVLLLCFPLSACNNKIDGGGLKIAFITDGTSVEDNFINKNIWNTLQSMVNLGVEYTYSIPQKTDGDSLKAEIKKHVDKGYNMIILASYLFADVLQEAQILYKDVKFIALDFKPQTLGSEAVSISFASNEAGFIAGFASALALKTGRFGALLGLDIPIFQQYSLGFQQGVLYANENHDTTVSMAADDFIYIGSVTDDVLCQQSAARLFDSGVDCVFVAAGNAGIGAIIEARHRRANGSDIWVVGSDQNEYLHGLYDGSNSVVLTSAIKRYNDAILDMVDFALQDKFPGGQTLTYNVANNGTGIPGGEINLTPKIRNLCIELAESIAKGDIKVSSSNNGTLIP